MRIKASGVGRTIEDALVKVRGELKLKARQHDEVEERRVGGELSEVIGTDENEHAENLEAQVLALGALVKPLPGYLFRVLVSVSDDRADAHARIEVDLTRE